MKFIITVQKPDINSPVEERFGRADWFLLVDNENMDWESHQNAAVAQSGGAGVSAAQFASDQGAEAVVSGRFGPNASRALAAAGLTMYVFPKPGMTAKEVAEAFQSNSLPVFNE